MKPLFLIVLCLCCGCIASAQVEYPYPVRFLHLTVENQPASMAYMDVQPQHANGKTVVLLHGKNFNGFYWKDVIPFLTGKGYRVVVPDQVGWGKSSKPNLHYSFHLLASNTRQLLDTLGISKVILLVHSMGGMLGSRFTLMYPERVEKLVYENPIGLEDYKTFVPYTPVDSTYAKEAAATYASYKKYQQSYYPEWKPAYEPYVAAQAAALQDTNFAATAWANAVTYQMIYEQPVVYELERIRLPVLLIIGQADRTVVGKDKLNSEQKKRYGNYPLLGRQTQQRIKGSRLVELPGVGHIPHVQDLPAFTKAVAAFLDLP
jgi:pimeloyl-ACP methyl ester carboxylesterase